MTGLLVALAAVAAGLLIGVSLGALGGGGSILAVPVLVYLLGQSPGAATTGSLVVVGATAAVGAWGAWRGGEVDVPDGLVFAAAALLGTTVGAWLSAGVPEDVLLGCFAVLMLVVAALMVLRQLRPARSVSSGPSVQGPVRGAERKLPRVLVAATVVGILTGFLGVGGGFLIVPALTLGLGLPIRRAAGTSLLVVSITSFAALLARLWAGVRPESVPDWLLVGLLGGAAILGALLGTRVMARTDPRRLAYAFTALVVVVACFTAAEALPGLARMG